MKWVLRSGVLALFAVLLAANVKADTILEYTLTQGSTTIATFGVPLFPASDPSTASTYAGATNIGLIVTPLNLVINGVSSPDVIEFFSSMLINGGGLEDMPADTTDVPAFNLTGPQLYTGNEAVSLTMPLGPTMSTGPFTLFACSDLACDSFGDTPYTLSTVSVTETVPTPEPSSLLLLGMGLTGLLLVRKRYAAN